MLLRSDLDALRDVPIAEAAKLRTDQVLDCLHFRIEELVRFGGRQLENRVILSKFVTELLRFLDGLR